MQKVTNLASASNFEADSCSRLATVRDGYSYLLCKNRFFCPNYRWSVGSVGPTLLCFKNVGIFETSKRPGAGKAPTELLDYSKLNSSMAVNRIQRFQENNPYIVLRIRNRNVRYGTRVVAHRCTVSDSAPFRVKTSISSSFKWY